MMNPRIQELFEQTLEEFKAENKYATIIVPNPLKEKFAELIILECTNIVLHYTDVDEGVAAAKKHFGVRE